jgi:hypothetical protein
LSNRAMKESNGVFTKRFSFFVRQKSPLMYHLLPATCKRSLLLILTGLLLIIVQGCTTTYNNKNWRRPPPSTGHNRCGCLMQKNYELISKQYGEISRA